MTIGADWGSLFGGVSGPASIYAGSPDCGTFSSSMFSAQDVRLTFGMPELFSPTFGLMLAVRRRSERHTYTHRPAFATWVFDNSTEDAIATEHELRLETTTRSVNLGAVATLRLGERLTVGAGPDLAYRVGFDYEQTDRILGPGDVAFPDGLATRAMPEGPVYTVRPFGFGLDAFAATTLPIGSRLSFRCGLDLHADFISPVNEADWRSFAVGINAGLLFDLFPAERPAPSLPNQPEPLPPPEPVPLRRLSASIDIYGLDGGKRTDVITTVLDERDIQRTVRIIPVLFIDREISEVSSGATPATLPTLDSLARLDPVSLQERLPDLIGLRLAERPAATVVLRPVTAADAEAAIGGMKRIRDYLRTVWGIDPERVGISDEPPESVPPGIESANGRTPVIVTGIPEGITGPLTSHRLEREFNPPDVKVSTSHEAEAGIRAWEIVLESGADTIARYARGSTSESDGRAMSWRASERGEGDTTTIVGRFSIEDSTGARASASSEATLMTLHNRIDVSTLVDMAERSESILCRSSLGDGDSFMRSGAFRNLLRFVEQSVGVGSEVMIAMRRPEHSTASDGGRVIDNLLDEIRNLGMRDVRRAEPEELPDEMIEQAEISHDEAVSEPVIYIFIRSRF